jgi:hypothetical protein
MPNRLYLYLDEGGNFDFSASGTRHYSFTCVVMVRPFSIYNELDNYKYDVIEYGKILDKFHCCEDNPHVRAKVFEIISNHLEDMHTHSVIVRKCKTGNALQEPSKFYSKMLGYLIRYVVGRYNTSAIEEVIVITDNLPIKRQRQAFEKAIKITLADMLPTLNKVMRIAVAETAVVWKSAYNVLKRLDSIGIRTEGSRPSRGWTIKFEPAYSASRFKVVEIGHPVLRD